MAVLQSISFCPPFPEIQGVEFRHCPDYLGYAVSSDGKLWSCRVIAGWRYGWKIGDKWKNKKSPINSSGYYQPNISVGKGKIVKRLLHHLILEAFVGPRPLGSEGCHANGDRLDNHLSNLRWDTPSANQQDSIRHGTHISLIKGESHPNAKLSDENIRDMRQLAKYCSGATLAKVYGISRSYASHIISGRVRGK